MPDDLRLPPQDLEAEQCVLGSCAVRVDAIDVANEMLTAEMFYSEKHEAMWRAMVDMREKNRPVDAKLLAEELERRKQLEKVGGARYILEVLDTVPHAAHVKFYAERVREKWRLRTLSNVCTESIRECYNAGVDSEDAITRAENGIAHLRQTDDRTDGPSDIGDLLADALNAIGNPNRQRTVTTTFNRVDQLIGGFPIGGLTIIGATKSSGKTALAMSIAVRLGEAGVATLIVTYEQPKLELAERALAVMSGVSFFLMHHGRTTPEQNKQIVERAGWWVKAPISIDDSMRPQSRLAAMIRNFVRRKQTRVVIVDYITLIPVDDGRLIREQQVANLSRMFKRLAMELKIVVIVLAQLNRQCEIANREPELHDLRESGSLEQDGDLIGLLFRPNRDTDDPQNDPDDFGIMKWAKHRNGPTGRTALDWEPTTMTYRDIDDPIRARQLAACSVRRRSSGPKNRDDVTDY